MGAICKMHYWLGGIDEWMDWWMDVLKAKPILQYMYPDIGMDLGRE